MSKFLSIVRDSLVEYKDLTDSEGWGCEAEEAINEIDSLGENARRLLEIGIVQDRLAELGFKPFGDTYVIESMGWGYPSKGFAPKMNQSIIRIDFDLCYVTVSHNEKAVFSYTSPIWQDDLINTVKELIDAK